MLGLALLAAIVIWDVGLPGRHSAASKVAPAASPTVSATSPAIPGVLQPKGAPEYVETFAGTHLNRSIWNTCYPYDRQSGCTNYGNTEFEWYLPSQVQVHDGFLQLIAQPQPTPGLAKSGAPMTYSCRSGMVTSFPGIRFHYGYIQVVAWLPADPGLWPGVWLAAANFQWPPEVDLIETWGVDLLAGSYFHYGQNNGHIDGRIQPASRATGWHTYAFSWTKSQMTWLLDGKPVLTVTSHVPHQLMYLIANLAEYKRVKSGPDMCRGSMLIKSVKVWRA